MCWVSTPASHMYTCMNTTPTTTKRTSNTKSRVYFWKTFPFFQACFCHHHFWSRSCLKSAGHRTAQHSLSTERGGFTEMMEKTGAVIGLTLKPRNGRRNGRNVWGGGRNDNNCSLLTPLLGLKPLWPNCLTGFHFHLLLIRWFGIPCQRSV